MPAPKSPASKALAATGVKAVDLARIASVNPSTISRWLDGKRHRSNLPMLLGEVLNSEDAAEVLALIPARANPN